MPVNLQAIAKDKSECAREVIERSLIVSSSRKFVSFFSHKLVKMYTIHFFCIENYV